MSEANSYSVVLADGSRFGPASMELLEQWAREGRVPREAKIEAADGLTPARPVMSEARLAAVLGAPPMVAGEIVVPVGDGGVSTLIPYKNGFALAAYYLAIFGLLPLIGVIPALVAVVMGILGVKKYYADASAKGIVHAWIGIVLGVVCILVWGGLIVMIGIGAFV